jgi:hypothetical protein
VVESFGKMSKIKGKAKKEAAMKKEKLQEKWRGQSEEMIVGMSEWREKHPRATMREIEQEIDKRLSEMRARMIADIAMKSASAGWEKGEARVCPKCGGKLLKKGKKKRKLETQGGQEIEMEREYGMCLDCGYGFFPPG